MLIEINMLKNCLPSNLNRDENGTPKTCMFGEVKRNRISSQCLKRSWRTSEFFQDALGEDSFGVRTRNMPEIIAGKLVENGIEEEVIGFVKEELAAFGTSDKSGAKKNRPIIMYSAADIEAIAEEVLKAVQGKTAKDLKKKAFLDSVEAAVKENSTTSASVDMALWGRMVTSDVFANVPASMRVSHAVSTNKAILESDFFTTVDDCLMSEDSGSAMLDYVDYSSACYYIYASIDTDVLLDNLSETENGEEVLNKIIPALVETMAYISPSGKQTAFATASLPAAVLVEIKDKKIPMDYSKAFESPAKADQKGSLSYNSACKLAETCNKLQKKFNLPVRKRLWFCVDDDIVVDNSETCEGFNELINGLEL